MSGAPDDVPGWQDNQRRADGMRVEPYGTDVWCITTASRRVVAIWCKCCGSPLTTARAAKAVADIFHRPAA
jgi:hypothetical protein